MLRNEVWLLPMNPGGGPVERGCGGDSWQKFFGEVFDLAIYASCDPPSRGAPSEGTVSRGSSTFKHR